MLQSHPGWQSMKQSRPLHLLTRPRDEVAEIFTSRYDTTGSCSNPCVIEGRLPGGAMRSQENTARDFISSFSREQPIIDLTERPRVGMTSKVRIVVEPATCRKVRGGRGRGSECEQRRWGSARAAGQGEPRRQSGVVASLVPHPANPAVTTRPSKLASRRIPDDSAAPSCLGAPGPLGACRFSR